MLKTEDTTRYIHGIELTRVITYYDFVVGWKCSVLDIFMTESKSFEPHTT